MQVSQAFNIINQLKPHQVKTLADLLPLELIEEVYSLTETVALIKRKLTFESMDWLLILLAIYNDKPMTQTLICLISSIERVSHLLLLAP